MTEKGDKAMKVVKHKASGNIYKCYELSEGLLSALRALPEVNYAFQRPYLSYILASNSGGVSRLVEEATLAEDYVELGPYTGPEEWADRGYYPLPSEELPQESGQAIWIRWGHGGKGYEGVGYTFTSGSGALGCKLLLPRAKVIPFAITFLFKEVEVYEWKSVSDND